MVRGIFALAIALAVCLLLAPASERAIAQDSPSAEAPQVGAVVFADPIAGSPGWPSGSCPTGRNKGEPVGEGYIFKVTGPCREGEDLGSIALKRKDILVPDGEVRVDVKIVSGHERAGFFIGFRDQGEPGSPSAEHYEAAIAPALGLGILARGATSLVVRRDLAPAFSRDDWNTLALRALGPRLWVLVNGQLIVQASDPSWDSGRVFFALVRLGDVNDGAESAAVIRNLTVSSLAAGDPARAPRFVQQ
jgi:hypothetical protein